MERRSKGEGFLIVVFLVISYFIYKLVFAVKEGSKAVGEAIDAAEQGIVDSDYVPEIGAAGLTNPEATDKDVPEELPGGKGRAKLPQGHAPEGWGNGDVGADEQVAAVIRMKLCTEMINNGQYTSMAECMEATGGHAPAYDPEKDEKWPDFGGSNG